jgi:putative ABC transport system permease protein
MLKYILKRAFKNIIRIPGRSLLLGIILMVISVLVLVGLSIQSGTSASITEARKSLGNQVTLSTNFQGAMRRNFQRNQSSSSTAQPTFVNLTESVANKLLASKYVIDHDYIINGGASSDTLLPIEDTNSTDTGNSTTTNNTSNNNNNNNNNGNNNQGGFRQNMPQFQLYGDSNPSLQADFRSGAKKMVDGVFYTTKDDTAKANVAVVDKLLADQDKLKVGSTISLTMRGATSATTFKVIGIYQDSVQSDPTGPSSFNIRNNTIYVPFSTLQKVSLAAAKEAAASATTTDTGATTQVARPSDYINSAEYFVDDPLDTTAFQAQAKSLGVDTTTNFSLSASDSAFNQMVGPMQKLADFAKIGVIAVLIAGAFIMILMMTIITRERKSEVGVLRALGGSRSSIAVQFAVEAILICFLALFAGGLVGTAASQSVADYMLNKEVQTQDSQQQNSQQRGMYFMGRGGFDQLGNSANTKVITTTKADVGANQLAELLLAGLFICLCGTVVSTYWIMKYEPMKILNSRN